MDKNILNLRAGDSTFYQYNPTYGFWGIPGMARDVQFTNLENRIIHVRHNLEGNRDKEITEERKVGSILCLGGSHTWGAGVDQTNRYTELLEQKIDRPVFNLGHCSFGLDQICLVILGMASKYKPSVIVVEQYPWAIHRVLNNYVNGYTRPFFYLDAQGELRLQRMSSLCRIKPFRRMIGAFYSYKKEFQEFKAGISLKEDYNPWTDPIFLAWKSFYYDYMYRVVDQILGVIKNFCHQENIRLIFGIGAIMQQFGKKSPSSLIDYDLPRKRLSSLLEKNGIAHVNMAPAMLAEHTGDDPVIFHDGHLNAKGHSIFAREIVRELEIKQWI